MSAPLKDLAAVVDAHRRLLENIEGLTDEAMRCPSLLPGWSGAHVLTHLARNADSHVRRTHAAIAGVIVDQYPGGPEGRAAEIAAGATRPAAEILEDVRRSADELDDVWQRTPEAAWSGITRDVSGRERPLHELPARRWQEVEIHLVDLDIGVSHRDWSEDFVAAWLAPTREQMASRLPERIALPHLDRRDELAWLYGRLRRQDLPPLPSWG